MKASKILRTFSRLTLICAFIVILVPVVSASFVEITQSSSASSANTLNFSLMVVNKGFLPLHDVIVRVNLSTSTGKLVGEGSGPVISVAPFSSEEYNVSVKLSQSLPSVEMANLTITTYASMNFGGLLPFQTTSVSASQMLAAQTSANVAKQTLTMALTHAGAAWGLVLGENGVQA